ncbi:MAG: transposase [Candidatus Moranbacteria bacterium]|nr:transposase [Candidatus Moranbacteria bacterium]
MRTLKFANDQYYHIYNRGTDKRKIFLDDRDHFRFLLSLDLLNDNKDGLMIAWRDCLKSKPKARLSEFLINEIRKRDYLVEIIAYCLNPNHYHLILKQLKERGIERFCQKFSISYTKYFNERNKRSGVLFQGRTKSATIKTTGGLLYLSAYVNCNCEIHGIAEADNYKWSSFACYAEKRKDKLCRPADILSHFKNGKDYFQFAKENAADMKIRKKEEKLLLE